MPSDTFLPEHRLSAILFADARGYSAMMAADEDATLATLDSWVEIISRNVNEHGGRLVNRSGDGLLAEFSSAVAAVRSAVDIQRQLKPRNEELPPGRRVVFRIGVHMGEVIAKGSDVFGDCVNVAARLESVAEPGGITISRAVHEVVQKKLSLNFVPLGPLKLRKLAQPVEAFRVDSKAKPVGIPAAERSLPSRPSLVVLPFANQSGDPGQEFFSDGITEDITSNISRFRELFVIARASAFSYKGKNLSITDISRDLGVRYVVEGSVRRSGDRIRVNTLLVDAVSGHELWAERYDRQLKDIFAVQDEVTQTIAANLKLRIDATERQSALRADTAGLAAYGYLLRGHEIFHAYTKPGNSKARGLYKRALTLDPVFCRAYSALSKTHNIDWRYSWSRSPSGSLALALELARRAVDLDELDARGHGELGFAYLYHRQVDQALAEYDRARTLNPNDADILAETADALIYDGRPGDSLPLFEQAIRLNPYHPDWYLWYYGSAMFQLQLYEEAIETLKRMRDPSQARRLLAASHAYLGRVAEAERYSRELLSVQPGFTVEYWATTQPFKNKADLDHFTEGLRKAGLP